MLGSVRWRSCLVPGPVFRRPTGHRRLQRHLRGGGGGRTLCISSYGARPHSETRAARGQRRPMGADRIYILAAPIGPVFRRPTGHRRFQRPPLPGASPLCVAGTPWARKRSTEFQRWNLVGRTGAQIDDTCRQLKPNRVPPPPLKGCLGTCCARKRQHVPSALGTCCAQTRATCRHFGPRRAIVAVRMYIRTATMALRSPKFVTLSRSHETVTAGNPGNYFFRICNALTLPRNRHCRP